MVNLKKGLFSQRLLLNSRPKCQMMSSCQPTNYRYPGNPLQTSFCQQKITPEFNAKTILKKSAPKTSSIIEDVITAVLFVFGKLSSLK